METEHAAGHREHRLARSIDDRMVAGVAGGVAEHLGVDPTIVRIAAVVLALTGGIGLPLYLAAWALMPEEGATRSLADDLIDRFERI